MNRRPRKARVPRKVNMSAQSDRAHIVEAVEEYNLKPNFQYSHSFQIKDFSRALILAGQFRFYRAKLVEVMWQPQYNTFQAATGTPDIPFMYYIMNRNGESTSYNVDGLRQQGATPVKFNKQIVKKYKPNTLIGTLSGKQIFYTDSNTLVAARANWTFSPTYDIWQSSEILTNTTGIPDPTNGNSIGLGPAQYYGMNFLIDQDNTVTPADTPIGKLIIKVHWEFKEPRILGGTNQSKAVDLSLVYQNLA